MFILHFKMTLKAYLEIPAQVRRPLQTLDCTVYLLEREDCCGRAWESRQRAQGHPQITHPGDG